MQHLMRMKTFKTAAAVLAAALITSCTMNNPLLEPSGAPFGAPAFDKIKTEHYKPAFKAAVAEGKEEIKAIVENPEEPTFANTIEALERAGGKLENVISKEKIRQPYKVVLRISRDKISDHKRNEETENIEEKPGKKDLKPAPDQCFWRLVLPVMNRDAHAGHIHRSAHRAADQHIEKIRDPAFHLRLGAALNDGMDKWQAKNRNRLPHIDFELTPRIAWLF